MCLEPSVARLLQGDNPLHPVWPFEPATETLVTWGAAQQGEGFGSTLSFSCRHRTLNGFLALGSL